MTMPALEPLIAKSMKVKGYDRITATERAEKWLARELGVMNLSNLDFIQQWTAEAIIERAMLPPPRKHRKKMEIPQHDLQRYIETNPLGDEFWAQLKAEWGEDFFNAFFGEKGQSKAMLSPGQKAQREFSNQELILA